jgi:serine/threonine protein kinase
MVSHYLPGGNLTDLIAGYRERGGTLPPDEILRIATEIAAGLTHIHGRRIRYRDVQPRNVLFDEWNNVRLVDFDRACSLDESEMSDISDYPAVEYGAPEELDGGPADERADL